MHDSRDLVQIIIPCFNGEEYLEETLCSIQNQTYKNFDCLMIDDGSNDLSTSIFKAFTLSDSRFRMLKNETNCGESFSVNRGWSNKRGSLVSILSCDDPQPSDWLEALVTFRESNPGYIVYYPNRNVIDEKGNSLRQEILFDWSATLLERDLLCVVSVGAIIDTAFLPSDFLPRISEVVFPSDLIQYLRISHFGTGLRHPYFFSVWREHNRSKSADDKGILAQEFTDAMCLYLNSLTKVERRVQGSAVFANVVRILQGEFSLLKSFTVGLRIFNNKFGLKTLNFLELLKILIRFRQRKALRGL
jgi:glycosyltransferase involved in cell wall biosynthesis